MPRKKYDLTVKVGEYQDRSGQTKSEWKRIGVVMQNDDGSEFAILDRTFNPAGVPNPENRSTVLVNFFEPRDDSGGRQSQPSQSQPRNTGAARPPATNSAPPPPDDDIPF